jgi:S-adenosylmethionine hydrolase
MTRRHGDKSSRASASSRPPGAPITLLTDFGTADYFVAAVKGVILSARPAVVIVDITHEIPPQDVEAAAFTLLCAYQSFPAGTINLAVVDPGVGSARRALLIEAGARFFVGPDNGIFSFVCEREESPGLTWKAFQLTNTKYFRWPTSATFHGRDVFAPVAAALAQGVTATELGTAITGIVRLPSLEPLVSRGDKITGRVLHIDRFGNCVTNLTADVLTADLIAGGVKLKIRRRLISSFRSHFAEETVSGGQLFAVWGSAGFLEIAVKNGSAAKVLHAKRGDQVWVLKG